MPGNLCLDRSNATFTQENKKYTADLESSPSAVGNLSTATGIRTNPATSHLSLMEKQFMIPMKSVTFLTPIFLAFQRYPMKNSEM